MKEQEYLLKKFVRASSALEALKMDKNTAVHEVYLVADKPEKEATTDAVGFRTVAVEE
jgi:hypothetical protein